MTRKGNNDGITVESKRVIPFFIPSLALLGFKRINVIKSRVHNIFGRCETIILKCFFSIITTQYMEI